MAATSVGATAIGHDYLIGTIEPGRLADQLVVDGGPLDDISILTNPDRVVLVMRNGWLLKGNHKSWEAK